MQRDFPMTLLEWLAKYEPLWLFLLLSLELLFSAMGLMVLAKRLTQRKTYRRSKKDDFESLTDGEGR